MIVVWPSWLSVPGIGARPFAIYWNTARLGARRDEPDEKRHGRTGAERCQHTQGRRQRIICCLGLACKDRTGLLRAEPTGQYAGDENGPGAEQEHLW